MSKGFGSIHAAAGMKNYLERKVKSEIERTKPGPRNAQVVSIDRTRKKCEVRYPGESDTVWVPYGSVEPAEPGLKVKIDGPVGERRIVEVYGKTRATSRIERLESAQTVSPIWAMSMSHWAESFPLMLINTDSVWPDVLNPIRVHCSPIVIPSDMHLVRIECKVRVVPTQDQSDSKITMAIHKVDLSEREVITDSDGSQKEGDYAFNLKYLESSPEMSTIVGDAESWRIAHKLARPIDAKAGDVYVISIFCSNVGSITDAKYPTFERLRHPTLPLAYGRHQFMLGNYSAAYLRSDVPRSAITTSLKETLWVAAFETNLYDG